MLTSLNSLVGKCEKICYPPLRKLFRFLTADGTHMKGGRNVVQPKTSFQKSTWTNPNPTTFETKDLFNEADIQLNGVLSHPWLFENDLGVIPHFEALTDFEPNVAL